MTNCKTCCRTAGKEEDSRWLSGTYLLIHPAAQNLGNARVRVKVLLELKPQSSGRANSRKWQVPQVAPTVIRAAGYSPRKPATHGPGGSPADKPAKALGHGALGSSQVSPDADPVSVITPQLQATSNSNSQAPIRAQPMAKVSTPSGVASVFGIDQQSSSVHNSAEASTVSAVEPAVQQGAGAQATPGASHSAAVSSSSESSPSGCLPRSSPGRQSDTAGQNASSTIDRSAPAQVEVCIMPCIKLQILLSVVGLVAA